MAGGVLGHERLGLFVLGIGGERGEEHQALSQRGIEAFEGEDAIHAVHAEEGGRIAHVIGLGKDGGSGGVVDGQEHEIGAGGLRSGQLNGEVSGGVVGEGAFVNDLDGLFAALSHEAVADALGVSVIVAVDHGDLRIGEVLGHVVSGSGALVGVGEADLEHIVLAVDDVRGGSGGSQAEHAVGVSLGGNGDGGAGGHGADLDLHTPVEQGVVGIDGLFAVSLVVLALQLKLHAAGGVELVDCDLGGVDNGIAIDGGGAGQGAADADLKRAFGRGGIAGIRGVSRFRSGGFGFFLGGLGSLAAAGAQRQYHYEAEYHAEKFLDFHVCSPFLN